MDKYLKRKDALKILGIHYHTLYKLAKNGEIETIKVGSQNLYNIDKYLRKKGVNKNTNNKKKICYCRVSSRKQKNDLERQIRVMKNLYPNHIIIKDIGSGLNFKRPGLKKIIKYALDGELDELIVAYKDRLTRFGFELIEFIIETSSDGKIVVLDHMEEKTPHEEVTEDILQIMNVYVAKINGLRKYKSLIKKDIENL